MRLRRVLPLAAVAVAAITVGFAVQRAPEGPKPAPTPAHAAPAVQTVARAPAPEHGFFDMAMARPATQSGSKSGGADWRVMQAKFTNARSLRAFVYDVLGHPKEGGFFYAFSTLNRCKANLDQDTAGLPERQRQAIDDLPARCDFSKQELDDARRHLDAIRNLDFADDLVAGPLVSFMQAKDDTARIAVLDGAIDAGNPMVLGSLVSHAIESALPADLALDRQAASDYARYAALLVECDLGAACSGDHASMVVDLCTKNGWCADNVRDALRIGLGDKFAPLDQLATRMTNDIRKRNYPPLLRGA